MNKDSFQQINTGKLVKSTMFPGSKTELKNSRKTSLEIQFGINQKKDNQFKTKQLKFEFL